jgi:hypothetical protein
MPSRHDHASLLVKINEYRSKSNTAPVPVCRLVDAGFLLLEWPPCLVVGAGLPLLSCSPCRWVTAKPAGGGRPPAGALFVGVTRVA